MPKYLRPLSDMRPMLSWALDSVREATDKNHIFMAIRKENEDVWGASSILKQVEPDIQLLILPRETNGPADTVVCMLEEFSVSGSFIVKDCDCSMKPISFADGGNAVFLGWRETAIGDRGSKSWVEVEGDNGLGLMKVTAITEKQRPTDWYVCGAYQFADADKFLGYFNGADINRSKEVFCSSVIQKMMAAGDGFSGVPCHNLHDWGTWDKYVTWRQQRKVYFLDIDGCTTQAGMPYGAGSWRDVHVLDGVKEKTAKMIADGCSIILVTSRPGTEAGVTEAVLKEDGVQWTRIVYGIPNGPRVLVNDYAASNPYPACSAINTKRNSGSWMEML
jgi:hypothetical protein